MSRAVVCVLGLITLVAAIFFFTVPLSVTDLRRTHLGSNYEQIQEQESNLFSGFRTFRDVPWEMFTHAHEKMATTPMLYYPIAAVIFAVNFALWYLWFPFRIFVDFKVTLLISLLLFEAAEFIVNSMSQFPPPPGFVQLEVESLSFFLGLVTQGGFGMLSSRAAFSFLLWYDWSSSLWPDRHVRRRLFTVLYAMNVCLFLLCTRQMYSLSLALNVLASFAVFHLSRTLSREWEKSLQQRFAGEDPESRQLDQRALEEGRYTVDSEEDEFVPEEENAVEQVLTGGGKMGAPSHLSRPRLSPTSKHLNLDAPANQVSGDL